MDDMERRHLKPDFMRSGFRGCIGEMSLGSLYDVDLMGLAKGGLNLDSCDNFSPHHLIDIGEDEQP